MKIHLTDMEELIANIDRDDARDYMSEALRCYQAGAFRACVVLSYIALFDDLRAKLRPLAKVNKEARTLHESIEKKAKDQEVYESYLADQLAGIGLIEAAQKTNLEMIIKLRNKAAHPSGVHASAEEARYVFSEVINKFLKEKLLQTNFAVDAIVSALPKGNFFPTTTLDDIKVIVESEISGLQEQAVPYLINKLLENRHDASGSPLAHVGFFLLGLAALKKDHIRKQLKVAVTKLAQSTDEAVLVVGLLRIDPALADGLQKVDCDRVSKLLLLLLDGKKPATRTSNPVAWLAAFVETNGQEKTWAAYRSVIEALIEKYVFDPEVMKVIVKAGPIQAAYLKVFEQRARSSQFDTANPASNAIPALDEIVGTALSPAQAFRVLASVAKAAEFGAFDAIGLRDSNFSEAKTMRGSAADFAVTLAKDAEDILTELNVTATLAQMTTRLTTS
jgi:hypothetical protein